MSTETATPTLTLEEIAERLEARRQRATYGAVAAVLNRPPNFIMNGKERSPRLSWIVSSLRLLPTGYTPAQLHPELTSRDEVLQTGDELRRFLAESE